MPRWWTRLVGQLTFGQSTVVLAVAGASGAAVGAITTRRRGLPRGLALGVVAADLAGGLVTFQLRPTRSWYATSTRGERLAFVAAHGHPFVLPVLGLGTWRRAVLRYTAAVGSTVLLDSLAASPQRRLVANALAGTLSAIDLATDGSDARWFGPAYLMKLVGGHGGIPHEASGSDVQVSAELAAKLLTTRWFVRAPLRLYERGWGVLVGPRILMLEHTGRRSGQQRRVCLEIVGRPAQDRVVLASGFGRTADWYRNLTANPRCHVTMGRDRYSATARLLGREESDAALGEYIRRNPRGWEFMRAAMTAATGKPVTTLPMVELQLDSHPDPATTHRR